MLFQQLVNKICSQQVYMYTRKYSQLVSSVVWRYFLTTCQGKLDMKISCPE
jgi:hypothetical protein